jgi:hypothetical protein
MVWRIDGPDTVPTLPAIPAAATEAFYSGGNQTTGTPATIVPAWWMNMVQEEIRNVVIAAGIQPNKHDNTQLSQAIQAITGGNIYLPLAGGTMTGTIFFHLPAAGPDPDPDVSGQRLSLWHPSTGDPDYAIGVEANGMWLGVSNTNNHFDFYGGTTVVARIPPGGSPPVQPYDLLTLGWFQQNARQVLTANRNYHVATTGNDNTGDGSAGSPWRTLQYAADWVQANLDFAGFEVQILLADGVYTGGLSLGGLPLGMTAAGQLVINGDNTDNTAVTIHVTGGDAIFCEAGASIYVKNLTVVATASGGEGGDGISAGYAGVIEFSNVNFGACSGNQIYASAGGSVIAMGGYQISGGAQVHAQAATGGYIELSSSPNRHVSVTLNGTPNFSGAFVMAGAGSISAANNTFPGTTATGPKFDAHLNGVIFTGNKTVNYFPGSVAGSVSTGGQYG